MFAYSKLLLASVAAAVAIVAAATGTVVAAPAAIAGDTYVYRVSNGYSKEARGQVSYRVDRVDTDRTVVSVAPDSPALGPAYNVVYTYEGNWLRHPVTNHDRPVEYEFAQAYPAYMFPLDPDKSWSVRVDASNPATGKISGVRVDGTVLGAERLRVPAGEFDTIRIRRSTYAGDWDGFLQETNIVDIEWYSPELGRAVRSESRSEWRDRSRCGRAGCQLILGDWNIYELVAFTPARSP